MEQQALRRIWWLASYPKSGNTWVRAFMAAYFARKLDLNAITHSVGDLVEYMHQVCSPVPVDQLSLGEYLCVHPAAMLHMVHAQQGNPLMVKTHNCNSAVDRCVLLPPQLTAGAIYIIRDPRDVCISWADHLCYPIDDTIEKMADEKFTITNHVNMSHVISDWSTHVSSYTNETAFKVGVVRYEDMVDDPEDKFRSILEYLGIPVEEDRLSYALEASSFQSLKTLEDKYGFNERRHQDSFFTRGTYGHWRESLTPEQIERIELRHGETMRKHGYEITTASLQDRDAA